jgi:O-antigen/teichoic acid export membrane protein
VKRFLKESVLAVGGEVAIFLGSLIFGLITARALGPFGKGVLGVLAGAFSMLVTILSLRFERAVMFFCATKPQQVAQTVSSALYVGVAMLFFIPLYWCMPPGVTKYIFGGVSGEFIVAAFLFLPNTYLLLVLSALLAGQRRYDRRLTILITAHVVRVLIAVVGLIVLDYSLQQFIVLFGVSELVLYLIMFVTLVHHNAWSLRLDWNHLREMVRYSAAGFLSIPSELVLANLFLFVLSVNQGSYDAGLFVVAIMMTNTLAYFANAIKVVILPYAASTSEIDESRVLRVLIGVELLMAIALVLLGRFLIVLLYGTQFEGSFLPAVLLIPGALSATVCSVLSASIQGRGRPGLASVATFLGSVCAVGLAFPMIFSYGINGAAVASTISNVISAVVAIVIYMRMTGRPIRPMLVIQPVDVHDTRAALVALWRDGDRPTRDNPTVR